MRENIDSSELLEIGEACLNWLAADAGELERFMALAGYSPQSLRAALGSPALAEALIDHFARNEPQLLALCANSGIATARLMALWHALNPND